MHIDSYLQRIGMEKTKGINLDSLQQLQQQHLFHIPFENIDVMKNIPIPLDVQAYYNKIVIDQRGGYCYELNGLFHWLLEHLGFDADLVSGTIYTKHGFSKIKGSHAAQLVYLDQPYLVDVGFGDSARTPLPLSGESRTDVSGTYRMHKVSHKLYDLQVMNQAEDWDTLYRVNIDSQHLSDFAEANHYNQTSPQSHFTQKEMISLATTYGRKTLSDNSLTITHDGKKQKRVINPEDKPAILAEHFHIYEHSYTR